MTERLTRADLLLAENIRALLAARHIDGSALSMAIGHTPSWLSKIMNGDRKMSVEDAGKVAAYFGLTISELLTHGVSRVTERRKVSRRGTTDRRTMLDRRHIDVAQRDSSGVQDTHPLTSALRATGVGTHATRPSTRFEMPRDWEPITLFDVDQRIAAAAEHLGRLYSLRKSVTDPAKPAPPVGKGGTRSDADYRLPRSRAIAAERRQTRR
jgi:transcriptional regulator with XRE-family HTH domain